MATTSSMPATPAELTTGVIAPDLPTNSTQSKPTASAALSSRANAFITQEKFSRRLTLPATESHGDLTVTYAIGGVDSADAPTMLFIGGMMGGRFLASIADYVATKLGMRVIVTDRPGIGGSTPVKPHLRLPVWLETVPILMRTLNAKHISLSAHSCGVIYAFNTIYSMPWILPPLNRKLYLFSPWVATEHSGMTMLSISSHLPSPLINSFDSIIRFVNSTVNPPLQFSGAVLDAVTAPFKSRKDDSNDSEARFRKHEREDLCREYCGVSGAEYAAQSKVLMRFVFNESIRGSNHEALLCLRKKVAGSWGVCDDDESYPDLLEAKMQEYYHHVDREGTESAPTSTGLTASPTQHPFVLKVFWAERDNMIGKKGEAYFDKCFQRFTRDRQSSIDECERWLLYESEVVPDTNHDTLPLPQYGALSKMLEDVLRDIR